MWWILAERGASTDERQSRIRTEVFQSGEAHDRASGYASETMGDGVHEEDGVAKNSTGGAKPRMTLEELVMFFHDMGYTHATSGLSAREAKARVERLLNTLEPPMAGSKRQPLPMGGS